MTKIHTKIFVNSQIQEAGLRAFETCRLEALKDGKVIPKDSKLSGGYFAALVAKNLGCKINPVLNDIDVFKEVKSFGSQEHKMFKKGREKKAIVEPDHYGNMWLSSACIRKYKVVATDHVGILNITNIMFEEHVENFGMALIEHFDINCTQICIDSTTKEVFYTSAFEKFLQTNVLEMTDPNTMAHTLIRLVKKSDELGIECNLDKEFQKFITEDSIFMPFFGEQYYKTYVKYKNIFDTHGLEAYEVKFEERQFPLFKLKRIFSPINHTLQRLYSDKDGFNPVKDIIVSSDMFYGLIGDEFLEKKKWVEDVLAAESSFNEKLELTYMFLSDPNLGKEVIAYIAETIGKEDSDIILITNNSETIKEATEWCQIIETKRYKTSIRKHVEKQVELLKQNDRFEKISIKSVLQNPANFLPEEFFKTAPKIGMSTGTNPTILGTYKGMLFIEAELKGENAELFGVAAIEKGEYLWTTVEISLEELEAAELFDGQLWVTEEGGYIEIIGDKTLIPRFEPTLNWIEDKDLEELPF